jgi:transposase
MLRMDQVHVIRHKVLIEGRGIRQAAAEMGVCRNTVRKYLRESMPCRQQLRRRSRPVWEQIEPRLLELLAEWEPRTALKQRLTAARLHQQLMSEGYRVSASLLRSYLRERRRQRQEVYIPLIHRPGEEAQVDFFEVVVEVDGEWLKAWEFLLRLMYSGREFAWLYERCDQLAFLDGHVRAFAYLDGVVRRCVYDNLKPAVRRIVGAQRVLSERFLALVSHYLFEPDFTRIGEGHDKGGVESRGKAIRLQHLTPIPRGDSLTEVSQALLRQLEQAFSTRRSADGRSASELWAAEQAQLLPLPTAPFEVSRVAPVEVSSQSLVRVEGAWYSVPARWARLRATAYIGVDQVRIVCLDEDVTHPRVRFGQRRVLYRHYLSELARKPKAVRQVAPELVAELGEPWGAVWRLLSAAHGEREAARVLARLVGAVGEHGEDKVARALEAALGEQRIGLLDVITPAPQASPAITVPSALAGFVIEAGKAADYDHLLLADGGAHE